MSIAGSALRDRLIFVVGARRSGTNWLQRVVCSHGDVVGVPAETYLFSQGIRPLMERFHHGAVSSSTTGFIHADRGALLDAVRDLCDVVFTQLRDALDPRAARILERTPEHATVLDVIAEVYPDARVIHIIRDPRDVVRSLLAQEWGPTTVAEAAEEWRSSVAAARAASARVPHYREVRYEAMLGDPRTHIADLFAWLGLSSGTSVEAALTEGGVRFNVDPTAPAVQEAKWRTTMRPDDVAEVERVAGDLLTETGYEPASRSSRPVHPSTPARTTTPLGAARRVFSRATSKRGRSFERDTIAHVIEVQWIVDQFLDLIGRGRFEDLTLMFAPTALIRIVHRGDETRGRGEDAVRGLIARLASDPAFGGRQLQGDVHPAVPTFTAVLVFETPDGARHERVFVVTVVAERITALALYAT